jgi:hypothetical protein
MKCFNEATRLGLKDSEILDEIGDSFAALDHLEQAHDCYQKIVDDDQMNGDVVLKLADLKNTSGVF